MVKMAVPVEVADQLTQVVVVQDPQLKEHTQVGLNMEATAAMEAIQTKVGMLEAVAELEVGQEIQEPVATD
jgi:hypothetical protein